METKYPLRSLYETYLRWSETEKSTLTQFFKSSLGVCDCAWDSFVDEIKHLKATKCTDFDRINGLYVRLDGLKSTGKGHDEGGLK